MKVENYASELESLLSDVFIPAGFKITKEVQIDPVPENANYGALSFDLNHHTIIFRVGKVTNDRPGAYLTVWQRPITKAQSNKPIPLRSDQLDFLLIRVRDQGNKMGFFIFPVSLLIKKGIVTSTPNTESNNATNKGKTGFRAFPPWSKSRGGAGMKVFSSSGKKTQTWQLPYFFELDNDGQLSPQLIAKLQQLIQNSALGALV